MGKVIDIDSKRDEKSGESKKPTTRAERRKALGMPEIPAETLRALRTVPREDVLTFALEKTLSFTRTLLLANRDALLRCKDCNVLEDHFCSACKEVVKEVQEITVELLMLHDCLEVVTDPSNPAQDPMESRDPLLAHLLATHNPKYSQ